MSACLGQSGLRAKHWRSASGPWRLVGGVWSSSPPLQSRVTQGALWDARGWDPLPAQQGFPREPPSHSLGLRQSDSRPGGHVKQESRKSRETPLPLDAARGPRTPPRRVRGEGGSPAAAVRNAFPQRRDLLQRALWGGGGSSAQPLAKVPPFPPIVSMPRRRKEEGGLWASGFELWAETAPFSMHGHSHGWALH